jgi:son of sevenless-like protein
LIKPSELVGQVWTKADKEKNAPHVLQMIQRFNLVSYWVMRTVVEARNHSERVDVLLQLLEILRELMALNNFNGVMEFVSSLQVFSLFFLDWFLCAHSHGVGGVQCSSIERLKLTWMEIPPKKRKVLDEASELMSRDKNFANARARMATCNPPLVPFFGLQHQAFLK